MRKTSIQRLADRLAKQGHDIKAATYKRNSATRAELDGGAWRWSVDGSYCGQPATYGARQPIGRLLGAGRLKLVKAAMGGSYGLPGYYEIVGSA